MSNALHGLEGPYVVLGKLRRGKGKARVVYHDTDPQNLSKTVCGVVVGLGYHYADEAPTEMDRCGRCKRWEGRP